MIRLCPAARGLGKAVPPACALIPWCQWSPHGVPLTPPNFQRVGLRRNGDLSAIGRSRPELARRGVERPESRSHRPVRGLHTSAKRDMRGFGAALGRCRPSDIDQLGEVIHRAIPGRNASLTVKLACAERGLGMGPFARKWVDGDCPQQARVRRESALRPRILARMWCPFSRGIPSDTHSGLSDTHSGMMPAVHRLGVGLKSWRAG